MRVVCFFSAYVLFFGGLYDCVRFICVFYAGLLTVAFCRYRVALPHRIVGPTLYPYPTWWYCYCCGLRVVLLILR